MRKKEIKAIKEIAARALGSWGMLLVGIYVISGRWTLILLGAACLMASGLLLGGDVKTSTESDDSKMDFSNRPYRSVTEPQPEIEPELQARYKFGRTPWISD